MTKSHQGFGVANSIGSRRAVPVRQSATRCLCGRAGSQHTLLRLKCFYERVASFVAPTANDPENCTESCKAAATIHLDSQKCRGPSSRLPF